MIWLVTARGHLLNADKVLDITVIGGNEFWADTPTMNYKLQATSWDELLFALRSSGARIAGNPLRPVGEGPPSPAANAGTLEADGDGGPAGAA